MEVTKLTGISWDDFKLTVNGKEVQAVPISQALLEFFEWLQQFDNTVLVAHNGKRFDFRILSKAVESCDLFDSFEQRVVGFVDSVHVLKEKLPQLGNDYRSHSQANLVRYFGLGPFNSHNAKDDANMLCKILERAHVIPKDLMNHSYPLHKDVY